MAVIYKIMKGNKELERFVTKEIAYRVADFYREKFDNITIEEKQLNKE